MGPLPDWDIALSNLESFLMKCVLMEITHSLSFITARDHRLIHSPRLLALAPPTPAWELHESEKVTQSCPTLLPHGLKPARFLCPWNSPVKNTRVGSHFLLQGIFLTQGLKPDLLHCRRLLTIWVTREARWELLNVSFVCMELRNRWPCPCQLPILNTKFVLSFKPRLKALLFWDCNGIVVFPHYKMVWNTFYITWEVEHKLRKTDSDGKWRAC